MTANGPYANASSWFGLAVETTRGTAAAAPAVFVPVKDPKIAPTITEVTDDGLRGSMVDVYDQIPAVRHDEYSFTCLAYLDTLGLLVKALLGGIDTVTGAEAPFTHTIGLLNNDAGNGNQPASFTLFDYDGYKLRVITAAQLDELTIKFTATGLVELTVKWLGNPYTINSGALPATAFSTVEATPAWACTATLNSVANTRIVDGSLSFKRGVKAVHTLGTQGPFRLWAGPLTSDGTLSVINSDDTEQNFYLSGAAFPLSVLFAPPSAPGGETFAWQMSSVKAKTSAQSRGGDGMIITDLGLQPLPNSTDATDGGVAPVKFVAVNAVSTGYGA